MRKVNDNKINASNKGAPNLITDSINDVIILRCEELITYNFDNMWLKFVTKLGCFENER